MKEVQGNFENFSYRELVALARSKKVSVKDKTGAQLKAALSKKMKL
jgi:hypothetical protein